MSRAEHMVTVEVALHALAISVGLLLRLLLLEQRPLSLEEGALATESYRIWQGDAPESLRQGPLTAYGVALTLAMFAGGDGAARLLSVLFGSVLLATPYLLRHAVGRVAALIAAWALAFSPLLVFASRDVGGGMVPLTLGLLLWWTVRPGLKEADAPRAFGAALLGAGLLASGMEGLMVLVTLGAAALLSQPNLRSLAVELRLVMESRLWRRAAAVMVAGVLAVGTGLGSNLDGVQWVLVDGWRDLLSSFSLEAHRGSLPLLLTLYELPIVALGMIQLARTVRSRDRIDTFLSLWAMLFLLIGMLQGPGAVHRIVFPLLPLYLLAARLVARTLPLAGGAEGSWRWGLSALAVAVPCTVGLVLLNRATTPFTDIPSPYLYGELALVGTAGLAVGFLLDSRGRLSLAWFALAILSSGFLLHSTVYLNYRVESMPVEPILGAQPSPFLRAAAADAAYFSNHYRSQVTVDPRLRAATEWYLRDAKGVQYSLEAGHGISFTLAGPIHDTLPGGSERRPGLYEPSIDLARASWQEVWRWAVRRDGLVRANQRDIIVRAPAGNW